MQPWVPNWARVFTGRITTRRAEGRTRLAHDERDRVVKPTAEVPDGHNGLYERGRLSPNVGPRGSSLPAELMWLADAPLFIDEHRVEAFYDAVFRPDYDQTEMILQKRVDRNTKVGANATVGAVFPGLLSKASIGLAGEHTRGRSSGQEAHYATVSNAYRNLLSLVLHYSTEPTKQSRLVLARTPITAFASENPAAVKDAAQLSDGTGQALDCTKLLPPSNYIRTPPRAMIMLDLNIGCKVIPDRCRAQRRRRGAGVRGPGPHGREGPAGDGLLPG